MTSGRCCIWLICTILLTIPTSFPGVASLGVSFSSNTPNAQGLFHEVIDEVLSGTLNIAVPCREGIIVCTDKRETSTIGYGSTDQGIKMGGIGRHGIFTINGTLKYVETKFVGGVPVSLNTFFDLRETVAEFYAEHESDDMEKSSAILVAELKSKVQALSTDISPLLQETPPSMHRVFFQVVSFYINSSKAIKGFTVTCYYQKRGLFFDPVIVFKAIEDEKFQIAFPLVFGNRDVFDELLSGNDSRFDDVRSEYLIRQFLRKPPQRKQVSALKALTLAKRLIEVSSERSTMIGSEADIGSTMDSALLSPKTGFQWFAPK